MLHPLLAVVLALLVSMPGAADAESTAGHLVLNGGGAKPAVVMEKFIELAGGRDAAILVFPTASERRDTGRYYRKLFEQEYDCSNVAIAKVENRRDAMRPAIVAQVAAARGIFFAGGDQRRVMSALHDTAVGEAVTAAHARGAVIGGTSAGTACQSRWMITGNGNFEVITADNVELWPGLGLFEGVIVDQHFVARQRENRLISVVLEHPELVGVGVDEATAVWVKPDHSFEVLGDGWVMVFDAAGSTIQSRDRDDGARGLGVHGLVTHVLLPGEGFDVAARRVIRADQPTTPALIDETHR